MTNSLTNSTNNKILATEVSTAKTFSKRAIGLLGKSSYPPNKALWIHRCRDIHTFCMRFPIDAIFVNKGLAVTSVHTNIKPWRLVFDWKASSVFEFRAGTISDELVNVGDQLHVDS